MSRNVVRRFGYASQILHAQDIVLHRYVAIHLSHNLSCLPSDSEVKIYILLSACVDSRKGCRFKNDTRGPPMFRPAVTWSTSKSLEDPIALSYRASGSFPSASFFAVTSIISFIYSVVLVIRIHVTWFNPQEYTFVRRYLFLSGMVPSGNSLTAAHRSAFMTTALLALITLPPPRLRRTPTAFPSSTKTYHGVHTQQKRPLVRILKDGSGRASPERLDHKCRAPA